VYSTLVHIGITDGIRNWFAYYACNCRLEGTEIAINFDCRVFKKLQL